MADRRTQPSQERAKPLASDRSAKLIHKLATDPPPKDIASVKAASDVYEANKKDAPKKRRNR